MTKELQRDYNRIPHSRATNSYDLLAEVAEAVSEEPRRLCMTRWQWDELPSSNPNIHRGPVCGTVGCFAGWIVNLKASKKKFEDIEYLSIYSEDISYQYLPEECHRDAAELFRGEYGSKLYPFLPTNLYGTPEYVKAALVNLHRFMAKWERELKAFKLVPPTIT